MTHHSLVLCKSVHHGSTRLVADRIAETLDAPVVDPDEAMLPTAGDLSLIGFGSGIYYGDFTSRSAIGSGGYRRMRDEGIELSCSRHPVCLSFQPWYHRSLRRALERKGFEVVGEFSCRGHDTFGPLGLVGGLNRKHPDEHDLRSAEQFAEQLKVYAESRASTWMRITPDDREKNVVAFNRCIADRDPLRESAHMHMFFAAVTSIARRGDGNQALGDCFASARGSLEHSLEKLRNDVRLGASK